MTFSPTPVPVVCGDVDCSGTVDGRDALGVILFLVFAEPVAGCISKGYVNCDGVLNLIDALVILRYAGGLPLGLPPGCSGIG